MGTSRIAAAFLAVTLCGATAHAEEAEVSQDVLSAAAWHAKLTFGGDLRSFDQSSSSPPVTYSGRVPLAFALEGDYYFLRYLGLALRGDYASYKLSDFAGRPDQPALGISTYALEVGPVGRLPIGSNFSASLFAGYELAHLDAFTFQGSELVADAAVRQSLAAAIQLGWRMKWFGVYARGEKPFAFSASYAGSEASASAFSAGGGIVVRIASLGPAQLAADLSYRYSSEHFEQPGVALAMNESSHALRLGLELEPEVEDALPPPPAPTVGFVAGTVLLGTDANAAPVSGATVTVSGPFGERTAATDAAGRFRFDGIPPGAALLHAQKNGLEPAEGSAMVVAGETAAAELRLSPPQLGFIAGTVLLGGDANAKPVPGATVTASGPFGQRTATTDEGGKFRFDGLPPGAASLHAQKSGLKPTDGAAMVVAGENAPTELRLIPEEDQHATLKGLVRNREGSPVSATLSLRPDGRRVETDAAGRFELRLDPGVQSVVIQARGYLVQRKKVQLKPGETVIFNIELFPSRYR